MHMRKFGSSITGGLNISLWEGAELVFHRCFLFFSLLLFGLYIINRKVGGGNYTCQEFDFCIIKQAKKVPPRDWSQAEEF